MVSKRKTRNETGNPIRKGSVACSVCGRPASRYICDKCSRARKIERNRREREGR
jgi:hypothetical protein